jgi:hypothetical protein
MVMRAIPKDVVVRSLGYFGSTDNRSNFWQYFRLAGLSLATTGSFSPRL